jgi:hypothetical protein
LEERVRNHEERVMKYREDKVRNALKFKVVKMVA